MIENCIILEVKVLMEFEYKYEMFLDVQDFQMLIITPLVLVNGLFDIKII